MSRYGRRKYLRYDGCQPGPPRTLLKLSPNDCFSTKSFDSGKSGSTTRSSLAAETRHRKRGDCDISQLTRTVGEQDLSQLSSGYGDPGLNGSNCIISLCRIHA
jgi:hypothetical protein